VEVAAVELLRNCEDCIDEVYVGAKIDFVSSVRELAWYN